MGQLHRKIGYSDKSSYLNSGVCERPRRCFFSARQAARAAVIGKNDCLLSTHISPSTRRGCYGSFRSGTAVRIAVSTGKFSAKAAVRERVTKRRREWPLWRKSYVKALYLSSNPLSSFEAMLPRSGTCRRFRNHRRIEPSVTSRYPFQFRLDAMVKPPEPIRLWHLQDSSDRRSS